MGQKISLRGGILLIISIISFITSPSQEFNILNSWDFENRTPGVYTDAMVGMDFNHTELYSHNSASITLDEINGNTTKVMCITHPAMVVSNGFEMMVDLEQDYNELWLSFNWKFGDEFNSNHGGKMPGLGGLPDFGTHYPETDDGFRCHNLFLWANQLSSYHYDRTTGTCPWGQREDSVFMANGTWYNITQRVIMNTFTNGVANSDGIKELWIDGKLVIQQSNLKLMVVESPDMKIDAFRLANFYGGSGDEYMPRTQCQTFIDNIKVYLPLNDPKVGTRNLHSASEIISTPDETINEPFHYDYLITAEGTLSNSQYPSAYSSCIDEAYLIDAGPGGRVQFNLNAGTIGGADYLFFYDGAISKSKLLNRIDGYANNLSRTITSSGRYLFIRFSTNEDGGSTGWTGEISFLADEQSFNNPPDISDQDFILNESTYTGSLIGQIAASDPDEDQTLTFSIVNGNEDGLFSVNSGNGLLILNSPSIFDSGDQEYNLTARVTDNGSSPKNKDANIRVTVVTETDVVNQSPVIEDQEFILNEEESFGSSIGQIAAYDPDPGQNLIYSITQGNESNIFAINAESGYLSSVSGNIFDHISDDYILLVSVTDGDKSDQAVIHITLHRLINAIYIDPENKNDILENGTTEHPYDSWQDVEWISGYNYRQKRGTVANESKIIVASNNVTIGGYGEGDKPVIWSSSQDYAISFFEKSDLVIKDIQVLAENAISCLYFLGDNSGNTTIKNSRFESAVYGIRIVGGSNYTIQYNSFYGISEAIYAYAGKTNIHYNIFQNNQNAVHIDGENSSADIFNNVFYDNNTSVSTSSSEMTLYNNIFYLTRSDDKAFDFSGKKLVSDHNIYYPYQNGFAKIHGESLNELSTLQQVEGIDINSFISDPLFVDALHHNFTVHHESPAIDAGIYVGITSDLAGMTVPYGNKPDIGVIEINELVNFVDEEKTNPILIFPNPSDGRFNITIDNLGQQQTSICIHDISGQKVMEQDYSGFSGGNFRGMIDISNFPSGVYILSMKITDYIYSRKILKSY